MSWFDLAGRNLISELDWTREEYDIAMKVTDQLKGAYYSRRQHHTLQDKTFAMLFFSGSTRTRMSFEAGMTQLGGHSQFLNPTTMRLSLEDKPGAGETVKDTAKAMARFCDGIGIRLLDDSIDHYGLGDEVMQKFGRRCQGQEDRHHVGLHAVDSRSLLCPRYGPYFVHVWYGRCRGPSTGVRDGSQRDAAVSRSGRSDGWPVHS